MTRRCAPLDLIWTRKGRHDDVHTSPERRLHGDRREFPQELRARGPLCPSAKGDPRLPSRGLRPKGGLSPLDLLFVLMLHERRSHHATSVDGCVVDG